jgi:protein SCO1/2
VTEADAPRPWAVVALALILAITAAWWALALWPLDMAAPDWVVRTREVCFGATRTGLPNAGGWLLLIGEPIGMVAVLCVVWGGDLRAELRRVQRTLAGRAATAAVIGLGVVGLLAAGRRVASATGADAGDTFAVSAPLPPRGDAPAAPLALRDQHGGVTRLEDYAGRWVMVTFAFGHCEDVCPLIVQQAQQARLDEDAGEVPLLVVTLDPWRDTPDRLGAIAAAWTLAAGDRVLSGSVAEVTATLDAWEIPRRRDETTGDVVHASTIVLVDPAGRAAWRIEGGPQRAREALAIATSRASSEHR